MVHQKAYNYALRLLARKDYSEKELRLKLNKKFSLGPHEMEDLLSRFKDFGYVDDSKVSKNYISYKLLSGYGKKRIKHELHLKGLSDYEYKVDDYFEDNSEEIKNNLLAKIIKKYNLLVLKNDARIREKLLRYLTGRGYSFDESAEILKEVMGRESDFS